MRKNIERLAQRETGRNLRDDSSRISKLETAQYPYVGLAGAESVAGDKTFTDNVTLNDFLTLASHSATISGGVITATGTMMVVDTEAAAATDDLDTINGGAADRIIFIRGLNSSRDVTLKHATGNLRTSGSLDIVLSNRRCFALGFYHATEATWNIFGVTIG